MFPVTYTFENGVYSTIINQNPVVGQASIENDMQKLMVPIVEPQLHIQPIQTSIQSQFQPPCSSSSSLPLPPIKTPVSSSTPKKYVNPFAPEATVPLPIELEDQFGPYSSSVWKRNERERCRVRNVNDGYERLRKHLPVHFE
uniref:BHLH domain-containing protein n=1 Tax=Caenorhabditis tropicalis TaxID=1561998 RepID=A0A1I7UFI9_9PELO